MLRKSKNSQSSKRQTKYILPQEPSPNHDAESTITIIEYPAFTLAASTLLTADDEQFIFWHLAKNPSAGEVICDYEGLVLKAYRHFGLVVLFVDARQIGELVMVDLIDESDHPRPPSKKEISALKEFLRKILLVAIGAAVKKAFDLLFALVSSRISDSRPIAYVEDVPLARHRSFESTDEWWKEEVITTEIRDDGVVRWLSSESIVRCLANQENARRFADGHHRAWFVSRLECDERDTGALVMGLAIQIIERQIAIQSSGKSVDIDGDGNGEEISTTPISNIDVVTLRSPVRDVLYGPTGKKHVQEILHYGPTGKKHVQEILQYR